MSNKAIISKEHAYSLSEMVKYFRLLVLEERIPTDGTCSDQLTTEYCDELIGALNVE